MLATDWRAPKRGRAVEAPAELGAVVEEVHDDFCGEIVAVDRDLHTVTLEDRRTKRRTFPLGPGFLLEGKPVILCRPRARKPPRSRRVRRPARSPSTARRPAWPGRAGSTSRAGTTPSSWRRSGATTCGSRAWSWSTSAASTTWPTTCVTSVPARTAGSGCWSTTSCPARRRAGSPTRSSARRSASTCSSSATRSSTSGRRSSPNGSGSSAGPRCPRNIEWKKGVCQRSAGRTATRPTSRGRGGRSCRRSRPTTTSIRRCSGGSRS